MLLYEYEGYQLFESCGIRVPQHQLITSPQQKITPQIPIVLKAQVLSGKRAQAGGVLEIRDQRLEVSLKELFDKQINGERVEKVHVTELIDIKQEYYLSFSYDTRIRGPVLTFSPQGGSGVESQEI